MSAPIPLVLALVAEADHPAGGALRERLASLGGEVRTGPSAVVITWEDSRGREEFAIRAARDAVKFARDAGLAARAAVHLGLPDPSPGAFAMARAAPDGAVWVSKAVERLVPRRFRFTELPVLQVGAEAVPPYEAGEELGSPGEFGSGEELGPFIERQSAITTLHATQTSLLLIGPPGSGRARLLRVCRETRRATGSWVAVGRCGERPASPGGAFGQMLCAEAAASGFDRWDGERVVAAVKRLGGSAEDADTLALSLGLRLNEEGASPAPAPDAMRAAWGRLLEGMKPRPLLCLENLGRATAEEVAILESLPPAAATVLATGESLVKSKRGFLPVPLREMSPDASRKLAARVQLAPGIMAAGNPLLIEQLGALCAEAGNDAAVDAFAAPDPLHDAIDARFEALPLEARETLAAASILGRSFWRFALERVLGHDAEEGLQKARHGGWILEREGSLMRADGELLFRHDLLREAAESSLAPGAPQQLHAVAAAFYEQRAPLAGPATAARAAWHRAEAARA
ncbi:MAG: hypothetical protein AAB074_13785 [Planctomycetota bacterium]